VVNLDGIKLALAVENPSATLLDIPEDLPAAQTGLPTSRDILSWLSLVSSCPPSRRVPMDIAVRYLKAKERAEKTRTASGIVRDET